MFVTGSVLIFNARAPIDSAPRRISAWPAGVSVTQLVVALAVPGAGSPRRVLTHREAASDRQHAR